MFVYRKTLDQIVRDFLESYWHEGDLPGDHQCHAIWEAGAGVGQVELLKRACTTAHDQCPSLLARLTELATPSMGTVHGDGGGGKKSKGPGGSPAPWAARPAELLDEIQRGALALDLDARRMLGFGPLHVAVPSRTGGAARHVRASRLGVVVAAPTALAGLPALWVALSTDPVTKGHWLAKGPDSIDERLRRWHRRAQLLTGHEVRWASVGQFEIEKPPPRHQGPTCWDGEEQCRHQSCRAILATPRQRWETGRCPYCRSSSLRQDPTTGNVVCLKPSCQTVDGNRHLWTVDELDRLGAIIRFEAKTGAA